VEARASSVHLEAAGVPAEHMQGESGHRNTTSHDGHSLGEGLQGSGVSTYW
jgi:hypothetical protein